MAKTAETSSGGFDPIAATVSAPGSATHQTSELNRVGGGRVAERVVAELRAYIDQNRLAPGDKLPPERVFLEQLGVSRSSLREAIRVLSTLGIVDVRHGDGMYVGAGADGEGAALFDASEEHALRNLVETRLGVELAAVTAATERASEEDIERLQALVDEHARALAEDSEYAWSPLDFELALIEAIGNTWLYEVELMLRDAWLSLSGGLRASVSRHAEWLAEHQAILASIRSRNVTQAQRLVMAHVSLERFEEDLRAARAAGTTRTRSNGRRRR
jgi:GntR family transcriptional regulator, transcriptional repressor for pyruvate dehydrogenase complex